MGKMLAAEVALAFNTVNERKTWHARPYASNEGERVHFQGGRGNMVTLILECETGKFYVRFNKMHAAWGDYVTSIAKCLYVVLTTLKAASMPFDAPDDIEGIEIVATVGNGKTYVRWPQQEPPVHPVMPELLAFESTPDAELQSEEAQDEPQEPDAPPFTEADD